MRAATQIGGDGRTRKKTFSLNGWVRKLPRFAPHKKDQGTCAWSVGLHESLVFNLIFMHFLGWNYIFSAFTSKLKRFRKRFLELVPVQAFSPIYLYQGNTFLADCKAKLERKRQHLIW